jgi:hypothetical protein
MKKLKYIIKKEFQAGSLPPEITTYANVREPFLTALAEFLSHNILRGRASMAHSPDSCFPNGGNKF